MDLVRGDSALDAEVNRRGWPRREKPTNQLQATPPFWLEPGLSFAHSPYYSSAEARDC